MLLSVLGSKRRTTLSLLLILPTLAVAGCSQESAGSATQDFFGPNAEARHSSGEPTPAVLAVVVEPSETSAKGHLRETWDVLLLGGAKVGYSRTTTTDLIEDKLPLVRIENTNLVVVNRSGQRTEHTIVSSELETSQGALVRFHTELQSGSNLTTFDGRVEANELVVETKTAGKVITARNPWPTAGGGFLTIEQSMLRQPMRAGERRTLTGLMAVVNQPVTMELVASAIEPTELHDHRENLLRVDCNAKLPDGSNITERLWVNQHGVILKRQIDALKQETYRTTRERALADVGPAKFDLMLDTTVRVNRAIESPHATRRVRYRVQLAGNDPAQVFASGLSQALVPLDNRTAEITVRAIRPTIVADSNNTAVKVAPIKPPTADDTEPNNLIQSDYPKIVALANEIAGSETDPWQIALRFESHVQKHIQRPNYSQAFATAADVADQGEGDCTEHAVLLAALCRSRGIPARVSIGLIYISAAQGFGYHMWNEVWIDGRWIPLDATLAHGGIGAAHLKLADSSLRGTTAFSTFLSVSQVIGQLKIEILEVE